MLSLRTEVSGQGKMDDIPTEYCFFLSSRDKKPQPDPPWGQYRHVCDPSACHRRSKSRDPTWTSVQVPCRFLHHSDFPSFSHFAPFQNIHRIHKPQSSYFFEKVFPVYSPTSASVHRHAGLGVNHGIDSFNNVPFHPEIHTPQGGQDISNQEERASHSRIKFWETNHAR